MNILKSTTTSILFILVGLFVSSCGSQKRITYFQDIDSYLQNQTLIDSSYYEIRIKPNDNLLITVSSINPIAAEPFNAISFDRVSSSTTLEWRGYLVDENGYINFPVIGRLYVANMTKQDLVDLLEERIREFFNDPVVNVRFLNYSVTVMGEVVRPGSYLINDEKTTVLQALAMAGDLTIYGERDQVLIARVDEKGSKQLYTMNLKDPAIFNSPYFYLQQNDVIYVAPNKAQASRSEYNQTWATWISVSSLLVTLANLIFTINRK